MLSATDLKLRRQIAEVESLPTLRAFVARILQALDSDDVELATVGALIAEDPAITGQILRMSNSIFYNASGLSTTSVHEAVSRIGCGQVRNLVVSLGVLETFRDLHESFDYPAFWRHSFRTAVAAGEIASRAPVLPPVGDPRDNPYFLAGLLHDVGTLLLCQQLGEPYVQLMERAEMEERPLFEMERELLGLDHQEVGAALIRRWGLPFEVAAAAEFHHRVGEAPPALLDYVVAVHGANLIGSGRGRAGEEGPVGGEVLELEALGVAAADLPELVEGVERAAEAAEPLLQAAVGC